MKNKENVLSKLDILIKSLNETIPINVNLQNVVADLEEIRAEVEENL
tara:strand:- start:77 stop:217 length:141 start_codon:yes stop_codon:yes gene_type:complete